jgi:glycosyltransferase involved in cell wall biosynthesis
MLALTVLLVLSAAYWSLTSVLTLRAQRELPRLPRLDPPEPVAWPSLSLIIPACDEGDTLGPALESRLAEDYPDLEIIVVDDRSTDDTGAIADAAAALDPRVRVIHVASLPPEWLGKLHAMARGAELARGEWLLFSDADVHLARGTLRRSIAHCEARGLDHLAVVPSLGRAGLWVDVVLSTVCRMIGLQLRVRAVEDPHDRTALGVGAFNLVRTSALLRSPGLEWLKLELIDDIALGQMLKRSGARSSIALGEHFVSLRQFYPSLRALMHGMEKNGFATLGRFSYLRLCGSALGFFTLECVPLLVLFAHAAPLLQASAAATLLLAAAQAVRANRLLGLPSWPALLFPIGTALLLGFGLRSGWLAARHGGISWRGTRYPLRALREGSRLQFP